MAYDEKQFLDLLEQYKSEETKKARRNASTVAFVILSAWILNVQLTDVHVLGVDISKTSETSVLLIALVLLVYWTCMFLLAWFRDAEIDKERALFLTTSVAHARERVRHGKEQYERQPQLGYPGDYGQMKTVVDAYEAQRGRTMKATRYAKTIKQMEIVVPLVLATGAAIVLAQGLLQRMTT